MRRNDKDALDGVLALPRFGGALLLYGACRVAQGEGGEEYECESPWRSVALLHIFEHRRYQR